MILIPMKVENVGCAMVVSIVTMGPLCVADLGGDSTAAPKRRCAASWKVMSVIHYAEWDSEWETGRARAWIDDDGADCGEFGRDADICAGDLPAPVGRTQRDLQGRGLLFQYAARNSVFRECRMQLRQCRRCTVVCTRASPHCQHRGGGARPRLQLRRKP